MNLQAPDLRFSPSLRDVGVSLKRYSSILLACPVLAERSDPEDIPALMISVNPYKVVGSRFPSARKVTVICVTLKCVLVRSLSN